MLEFWQRARAAAECYVADEAIRTRARAIPDLMSMTFSYTICEEINICLQIYGQKWKAISSCNREVISIGQ